MAYVEGTPGDDIMVGTSENDTLIGFEGDDLIEGQIGADSAVGGVGDDTLEGGQGADTLDGGEGDDFLGGGEGNDILLGGAGNDWASYATAAAGVAVSLAVSGPQTVGGGLGVDLLAGIEGLVGSSFADQLTGAETADRLEGGSGNDTLAGAGGNDTLAGGAGIDRLVGGAGDDSYALNDNDVVVEAAGGGYDAVSTELATATLAANVEHLAGLVESQRLTGNELDNRITGQGAATLIGGDGDDSLELFWNVESGPGYSLSGGDGDDLVRVSSQFVGQVSGGRGTDLLIIGSGQAIFSEFTPAAWGFEQISFYGGVLATDAADVFDLSGLTFIANPTSERTIISGFGGNDRLIGVRNGPNQLSGGAGDDTVVGGALADMLSGLAGSDLLEGGAGNDTLTSSGGGLDTLIGGDGADLIEAYADTDAMADTVSIEAGAGDDLVVLGQFGLPVLVAEDLSGGRGVDTLGFAGEVRLDPVQLADFERLAFGEGGLLIATEADDLLDLGRFVVLSTAWSDGAGGNDTLRGGTEADVFDGGAGHDRLEGGQGNDTLSGAQGNDTLIGGDGDDLISFGYDDGPQSAVGSIAGGAGDDVIELGRSGGGGLVVALSGGSGLDTVVVYGDVELAGVSFADFEQMILANSAVLSGTGGGDVFDVSKLGVTSSGAALIYTGSLGNDLIVGARFVSNLLSGDEGEDTLVGGDGSSELQGGAGDDLLQSGAGNDIIFGGAGMDTVSYANINLGAGVHVSLDISGVQNTGPGGRDWIAEVEILIGSSKADVLSGASVSGDRLEGAGGADMLIGLAGADTLIGGSGSDTLIGGETGDRLSGGKGADTFAYWAREDSPPFSGRDVIDDFNRAQGDRIDLSLIDANPFGMAGDQAFTWIGGASFFGVAQLRQSVVAGGTIVEGEMNGDGIADFAIFVRGGPLTAGDFML